MLRKNVSKVFVKILLGILFVCSALFKLFSLDAFEIYVYSLNVFSLNFSFIAARLLISFELTIGTLLILNIFHKYTWYLTIGILGAFSSFLIYMIFIGSSENCNCFGDFIKLSPLESLLKNIVFIAMLLFVRKTNVWHIVYEKLILIIVPIVFIIIPMIISPPDSLYKEKYSKKSRFNEKSYMEITKRLEYNFKEIDKGKKIICFFGVKCRFCELTSKKLTVAAKKYEISEENILIYFFGNDKDVMSFYERTNSIVYSYKIIPPDDFLSITYGLMPVILLSDDGVVKNRFGYRDFDEIQISNLFQCKD